MARIYTVKPVSALILAGILIFVIAAVAQGGSILDYGSITGNPAQGNYLAWVSTDVPPAQVLTEDGYNAGSGVNQGFVSGAWVVDVGTGFTSPAANNGETIHMLFGGLGGNANTIWTYSFGWDGEGAVTNHGAVGASAGGACPTMTQGSQGAGGKVINWSSTGASSYAIYRSTNASGAGNGASNGRYDLVTTVTGTTFTDTACSTGTSCWHIVVPLDASDEISGCHSEETNPTAVTLRTFRATDPAANWPLIAASAPVLALAFAWIVLRRRAAVRA